jgi:hypothetical protein
VSSHYADLAHSLRALGDIAAAAEATRERAALWRGNPEELYDAARDLALSISTLDRRPSLPPEVAALRERLAAECVATLERSARAGWSDASKIGRDPEFAPLQGRDDFRHLVSGLTDRTFPANPFAQ